MTDHFVTGKKGGGKSLFCVQKIREYLEQGRRVATNLDIHLDEMMPPDSRANLIRLPDKPRLQDFEMLGYAYDRSEGYREDGFGLIVMDECGTWFNSRSWNDKERAGMINWLRQARKYRWDVDYLIQDIGSIDKQAREAFCDYFVLCKDRGKIAVPIIGKVLRLFNRGEVVTFKKSHRAYIYNGDSTNGLPFDAVPYTCPELYAAYDTDQIFSDDVQLLGDRFVDMRASYTVLSAWHLKGRYEQPEEVKTSYGLKFWFSLLYRIPAYVVVAAVSAVTETSIEQTIAALNSGRYPKKVRA